MENGTTDSLWVEATDAAELHTMNKTAVKTKISKISLVATLTNSLGTCYKTGEHFTEIFNKAFLQIASVHTELSYSN